MNVPFALAPAVFAPRREQLNQNERTTVHAPVAAASLPLIIGNNR